MNETKTNSTFARTLTIGGFCARHLLALAVTIAVPCALWTIVYFALLLWAIIFGGGIGSPVAYPIGLLFFAGAALVGGLVLFLPSTVFAEWLVKRRKLPTLLQIPISVATLALFCLISVILAAEPFHPSSLPNILTGFIIFWGALLLPLGLYWRTAQSGPLVLEIIRKVSGAVRRSKNVGSN
jgi:hypothetical protein